MATDDVPAAAGLLSGVRVLDCSSSDGVYGGRLLADLGADVVRVEWSDASAPLVSPTICSLAGGKIVSAFDLFVNANKRLVVLDRTREDDRETWSRLAGSADLVLTDGDLVEAVPDDVVSVTASTFGQLRHGADLVGSDLVGLAAGGLLSLGGYPDTEPVAVYGHQAFLCGGIMSAVAALLALLERDAGRVPRVDVSVQTILVGAMEDATAEFDLAGTVRRRSGDRPREAGTGIFRSADGYVALVAGKLGTAQAWTNLVTWLDEEGVVGAEELEGESWRSLDHKRTAEAVATFTEVFEGFTSTRSSYSLYREGQRRSIAIAPVNTVGDVLKDPQLAYRDFFRTAFSDDLGSLVTLPGPPYRLFDLPERTETKLASRTSADVVATEWAQAGSRVGEGVGVSRA